MDILTQPQIYQFLDTVSGDWTYEQGMLRTSYEFSDFLEALSFVNDIAEVAENLGHHPDIDIRYSKVLVATVTHDADDQITDLDIALVEVIEELIE